MSCKCARYDGEEGRWQCSVSGDGCVFLVPNDRACAEMYGEGPVAEWLSGTGFSHEDAYVRDGNTIKVIAIYNKPDDFPIGYIARLFNGIEPTAKTVTGETLESIREKIPEGYTRIPGDEKDVGSLVESWIY